MCKRSTLNNQASQSKSFHKYSFHFSFFRDIWIPLRQVSLFLHSTKFFLLILGSTFLLPASGWTWEQSTHEELTKHAIQVIEANLNGYLIDNLGLEGGLDASVEGGTPRKLMVQGSNKEDNFPRFVNHFHEPIGDRGLGKFGGISAINWSLEEIGAQDGEDSFSWRDGREYYFKALTSPSKAERDKFWGKTFRALGQVMHLIQDSANPSHVRDDIHPTLIDDDGLHDYMARQSVASYSTGGGLFRPDSSLLQTPHTGGPPPDPLANLFDTNTYNGNNPGATLGTNVGITEYTSANFFSDDTIPGQSGTVLPLYPNAFELVPAVVPLPYMTLPRLGSAAFPAARAAKLTGNQAAAQFLLTHTHFDLIGKLELDDAVYDAQAQNLIPRAVDYSAAVLDDFFRGEMEVIKNHFVIDGTNQGGGVCAPIPWNEYGTLNVRLDIPSNLGFIGTISLYYERANETRVLGDQITNPQPGQNLVLWATVPHAEIANPLRWYVVLEGQAGPGTQEPRAVLAKTDRVEWFFACPG